MITKEELAQGYAVNLQLIQMQTEGLSHADSLIKTQYNINTLNWVLGHIAVGRDNVLRLLGEEPMLSDAETSLYKRGSEPVFEDGQDIIPLERLLDILAKGQEKINAAFERISEAALSEKIQVGQNKVTRAARLHGQYFHDTYHTGQTDMLRQIAGKNDKVIG